jgi:hypothetical protein
VEFLDLGFVSAFRNLFLFCFLVFFKSSWKEQYDLLHGFGALEIKNTRVLLIQGFSIQCVAELLNLGSVSAFGNLLMFLCFFSLLSRVSSTTCSHGLVS